ncbi:Putative ankyrin repeat protein MM_0045 [Geodia barretti]|uniref:Ankyrin repeat protein MM_0045 n=1 Tax=Geodia barretti TaxID=519541 RepID=A0AA35TY54_GEOBA|nr:Putative ankyrin repeat protein MM_0045 [Geodia barretti]
MLAAWEGRTEVVSLLLEAGAKVGLQNEVGDSALMLAARTEVVSLLLEAGAKVDLQNEHGDSALMLAARCCRTDTVSLLLEAGAKIYLRNEAVHRAWPQHNWQTVSSPQLATPRKLT